MTALIVIGIVLAVLALVAIAYFVHKQSKENFGVSPFSLGKLAFVAVAVAMAGIGWWVSEPAGGYLLDRGLNTTVLLVAAGLMYVGHTIWMIRKTNMIIGIVAPVFLATVSAAILAIVAFILFHGGGRKKSQESDN